jgi:galactonate dehydratase
LIIREVTSYLCDAGRANWVFVRLETDAGVHGWGESTLESHELAVIGAITELGRRLIGRDASDIQLLWQEMYRDAPWQGVVLFTAISGIDQALWDIKGKTLGVPAYELLGGAVRDRIRTYTWPRTMGWPRSRRQLSAEDYAEEALRTVSDGYTAMKLDPFGDAFFTISREELRGVVKVMEAIRTAGCDQLDLAVDAHWRFTPAAAIRVGQALAEFDLLFYEEPTHSDNLESLERVAQGLASVQPKLPLAAGERQYTKAGFWNLLQRQAVDIIQPDLCHVGGLFEARLVSAMAEASHTLVAPHNPQGPVSTAAAVQLGACTPNFYMLETSRDVPWRDEIVAFGPQVVDGYIAVTNTPGLGIDLDPEAIARHPGDQRPLEFATRVVA